MEIPAAMLPAARRAEFDHYRQNRLPGSRFIPMSDGMLRVVLGAAIKAIGEDEAEAAGVQPDTQEDEAEAVEPREPGDDAAE